MGKKKGIKKVSVKWARRMRKQQKLKKEMNNNKQEDVDSQDQPGSQPDQEGESEPSGKVAIGKKSKRQAGEVLWDSDHFPPCSKFQPPTKLPTIKSVVGRVRFLTKGGKQQMQKEMAVKQVALEIECKYYHDTVYCMPIRTIERKLTQMMITYRVGKSKVVEGGRDNEQVVRDYKELVQEKDKLFEVATTSPKQKENCELKWGVKMGEKEKMYLEDQRGARKMECDMGVDPVWFRARMKDQRLREVSDAEYLSRRDERNRGKNFDEIEQMMREDGEMPLDPPSEPDSAPGTPVKLPVCPAPIAVPGLGKKKKRLYKQVEDKDDDLMPEVYRHIRDSERKVRDDFYQTCADLQGRGLGADECASAVVIVANGMFGRKWRLNSEDSEV